MLQSIVLNKEAEELLKGAATPTTTVAPVIVDAPKNIEPEQPEPENETTTSVNDVETVETPTQQAPVAPAPATVSQTPQVTVAQAPKQQMSDEMLAMFAEGIVLVFDLIQETGFSWLANRKVTKKSYESFGVPNYITSILKKRKETPDAVLTEDETILLDLYERVKDFNNDLPLDQRQTDHITQSLVVYIKSKGYSFSPDTLMIFSLFSAIAPNFAAYKML